MLLSGGQVPSITKSQVPAIHADINRRVHMYQGVAHAGVAGLSRGEVDGPL